MIMIKKRREMLGMTQSELAEKLNLSKSAISQYESGVRKPDIITLKKLSAVLECTTDDLLESVKV